MPANYVLLQRIELNASAASVTFSNIPQSGYTDLKVDFSVRNTADLNTVALVLNGVSTNQTARRVIGTGSSALSSTYAEVQDNASSTTANTFASGSLYIPNYTSSNNKSMSFDITSENNATLAYATMEAWLWSSTAAITSVGFAGVSGGALAANSTFSLYGLAAVGTTPAIAPKASGGNITTDGTYWIHTFLTTGTFVPQTSLTCDYLVVAGGGGGAGVSSGGDYSAPGGGAGGYRTSVGTSGGGGSAESALSLLPQNYTVTVGAGGAANVAGSNSTLSTITSNGGGGAPAGSGGSGAGAFNFGTTTPGSGTANQGYAGAASSGNTSSGGGGGAGGAGSTARTGGAGITSSISGSSVARGGGGAAGWGGTATAGGGNGGNAAANSNGSSGTVNTGGGGGGGTASNGTGFGGTGGSGIVIIRYPIA